MRQSLSLEACLSCGTGHGNTMMRRLQLTILLILIPLGLLYYYSDKYDVSIKDVFFHKDTVLHIGDIPLRVEVANTDEERRIGLGGRDTLNGIEGMLFIFDEPGYHGIWMKDMRFNIDVIWISEDLRVVGITERLEPSSYPRIFEPSVPVKYIVETEPKFANSFGIRIGDSVYLPGQKFR